MSNDTTRFLERFRQHDEQRVAELIAAKAAAAARGKEPFDLDRFEAIYAMSDWRKEREGPRETRLAMRQHDYYVDFESVMTLEEYAREVWDVRDRSSDHPWR